MRGSETFAPFCASALDDKLSALRAHPYAEAMSLRASAIVGLKSSLHYAHLSIIVFAEKSKGIGTVKGLSRLAKDW